jgi:hypothetical protein
MKLTEVNNDLKKKQNDGNYSFSLATVGITAF